MNETTEKNDDTRFIKHIIKDKRTYKIDLRSITKQGQFFVCQKCNHIWVPNNKNLNKLPTKCPKCTDSYWFLPKRNFTIREKDEKDEKKTLKEEINDIIEPIQHEEKQTINNLHSQNEGENNKTERRFNEDKW